jgi:hypothetical protein
VAADVAPDGAVWFLDLQGKGYDLRRLSDSTAPAPQLSLAAVLIDSASPVLPPRIPRSAADSSRRPSLAATPGERPYTLGPSRLRYFPTATAGPGGSSLQLGLLRSDPVGRYGVLLFGSIGSPTMSQGLNLLLASHAARTGLTVSGWTSHEAPSRELEAAFAQGLDLSRSGAAIRLDRTHVGDGWDVSGAIAAFGESRYASSFGRDSRFAGVAILGGSARQRDDATRYEERLAMQSEAGRVDSGSYLRHSGMFVFGAGVANQPLTTLRVAFGNVSGRGASRERFAIGGIMSPLIDSSYDARRVPLPAYPLGSMSGTSFASYRVGAPFSIVELFYASATTDVFRHQLRSFGAEFRQSVPAIAALGTPALDLSTGFARAVDEPVKGRWQYFMTVRVAP